MKTSTNKTKRESLWHRLPDFKFDLCSWRFWRNSFLYFWVFSLLGHLLEYPWYMLTNLVMGWERALPPFFVLAAPYGLGAVVLLWVVVPIIKRFKIGILPIFLLSVVVTTVVEFLSALVPYLVRGYNPYWDYSGTFGNLFGWVCLPNSLIFGLMSIAFLYILFPLGEKVLGRIKEKPLDVFAVCLFVGWAISQFYRLYAVVFLAGPT